MQTIKIRRAILAVGVPCDLETAKEYAAFAESEYRAAFPGASVHVEVYSLVSPVSTDTHISTTDPEAIDKIKEIDRNMWGRFNER